MAVPPAPDGPGLTSSTDPSTGDRAQGDPTPSEPVQRDPVQPGPAPVDRSTAGTFRLVLAGVLALLLLGCLGALAWLAVAWFGPGREAEDLQREREAVMSTAEQFTLRLNTYGPELLDSSGQMPDYREGVGELLTPKFKADFDQNVSIAEQTVAQAGIDRAGEVFATGVAEIDSDSAQALVAGRINQSVPRGDERVESEPVPFRYVVDLVRIDDKWLVDDWSPAAQPSQEAPSGAPTEGTP